MLIKVGNDVWILWVVYSQKVLDFVNWCIDVGVFFKQWVMSQNINQLFFLCSQGSGGVVNIVLRYLWQFLMVDVSNVKLGVYQDYDKLVVSQCWFLNLVDGSCSIDVIGFWGSFMGCNKIFIGGDIDEVIVG